MDWGAMAKARTAEAFAADHPYYFLIGGAALRKPVRAQRTLAIDLSSIQAGAAAKPTAARLVLPVKKVLSTFPSMISVGRTTNNDIIIEDVQVSKFHALFRVRDRDLELEDAGSVNGTLVNNRPVAKGTRVPVKSGDAISFGTLMLTLHDSASAWSTLRSGT